MGTLAGPATRYLMERRSRGEISGKHARTVSYTLLSLDASFGTRPLAAFGVRAIERWSEQHPHLKASTRATYLSHIRQFADWLRRRKLIAGNPFDEVKVPRRPRPAPRPMSRDDIAKLLEAAPDARGRLIVWLMFGLGLRCVGVARINIEDVDLRNQTVHVTEKGGHERRLPLTNELFAELDKFLFFHPATSGPLLRNYREPTQALVPQYIGKLVTRWMREAGVKHKGWDGKSPHALRHTALTETAEAGADVWTLQELAGWASPATAAYYVRRASTERVRAALESRATL